jgi:ABC-type glycerol-3-phosphate transport system permease component
LFWTRWHGTSETEPTLTPTSGGVTLGLVESLAVLSVSSGYKDVIAMTILILIMIAPVVVMAIALERFITRGILVGALKG